MTIENDATGTRTEWATKLTWPDGHTEIDTRDGSRRSAESVARFYADPHNRREAVAVLVSREVTITDWQVRS